VFYDRQPLGAMAAVLDEVGKSKVSKKTEEAFEEDDEQEDVENESAVNKKRRKRRRKKAQTNGKCTSIIFVLRFICTLTPCKISVLRD